mgnify:CR=1 FL=1
MNKTVMAKGITISIFAFRLNSGIKIVGDIGINSILLNVSILSEFKIIIRYLLFLRILTTICCPCSLLKVKLHQS